MLSILIPGLLLVALMIYLSTRIKKTAAAAFDAETIETDEFVIQKPEGFLHNLNGDPKFIFEAYSKDFSKANDKLRVGTAVITRKENTTLDQVIRELSATDGLVVDSPDILDETAYQKMRRSGDETETLYTLAQQNGSVYELEITVVKESANDQWIGIFFDSFRVK